MRWTSIDKSRVCLEVSYIFRRTRRRRHELGEVSMLKSLEQKPVVPFQSHADPPHGSQRAILGGNLSLLYPTLSHDSRHNSDIQCAARPTSLQRSPPNRASCTIRFETKHVFVFRDGDACSHDDIHTACYTASLRSAGTGIYPMPSFPVPSYPPILVPYAAKNPEFMAPCSASEERNKK